MVITLMVILFLLLLLVGKIQGLKTFACFFFSYLLVIFYIIFIGLGFNAIILAIITCLLVAIIILFILNGLNVKTLSSFISISIVLVIIFIIVYLICKYASIEGFSSESLETIGSYSFDINYDMTKVIIGMYLICTIGTVIDTSLSISSSIYGVKVNNPNISFKNLFLAGMNIGKDILSTTINTLYFAFFGGFIGFFFYFQASNFSYMVNYKTFSREVMELICCFIASILIIPITTYLTAKLLNKNINI